MSTIDAGITFEELANVAGVRLLGYRVVLSDGQNTVLPINGAAHQAVSFSVAPVNPTPYSMTIQALDQDYLPIGAIVTTDTIVVSEPVVISATLWWPVSAVLNVA